MARTVTAKKTKRQSSSSPPRKSPSKRRSRPPPNSTNTRPKQKLIKSRKAPPTVSDGSSGFGSDSAMETEQDHDEGDTDKEDDNEDDDDDDSDSAECHVVEAVPVVDQTKKHKKTKISRRITLGAGGDPMTEIMQIFEMQGKDKKEVEEMMRRYLAIGPATEGKPSKGETISELQNGIMDNGGNHVVQEKHENEEDDDGVNLPDLIYDSEEEDEDDLQDIDDRANELLDQVAPLFTEMESTNFNKVQEAVQKISGLFKEAMQPLDGAVMMQQAEIWTSTERKYYQLVESTFRASQTTLKQNKIRADEIYEEVQRISREREEAAEKAWKGFGVARQRQEKELQEMRKALEAIKLKYSKKFAKITDKDRIKKEIDMDFARFVSMQR